MFDSESVAPPPSSSQPARNVSRLDAEQRAILDLTARGHSLKQVAYELGLSTTAACRRRQDGLRALGFDNVCHFVSAQAGKSSEPARGGTGPVLTSIELEIVRLVIDGCTNAEIARTRGRSARTIANQLARVYRKLGVQSRVELAIAVARRCK